MTNSDTNEREIQKRIKEKIRSIPDYPKPGILFRDITTLLKQPEGVFDSVEIALEKLGGIKFNKVAGIDSRGFIFGAAISYAKKKGFVPLPAPCMVSACPNLNLGSWIFGPSVDLQPHGG